jgi:hypothetical protein
VSLNKMSLVFHDIPFQHTKIERDRGILHV